MDTDCEKCGRPYTLRENCEPTPFCDLCAHGEVDRLTQLVHRLGKALHYQDKVWGLYGEEGKQTLRDYLKSVEKNPVKSR